MKMRKYFAMALVALGATAAFSSCQKDDKTYSDPKIEFRDANNKVITEFTKENAEIKVLVTLGDPSLKIKKCEAKVLKADGVVNPDLKLNFKPVSGGADDGKFEAKFTFADTKIVGGEKDPVEVKVEVTDSQNKLTRGELKYKAKGGETQTGTPMGQEIEGFINHAWGLGDGAFSFSKKDGVSLKDGADADKEFVNESPKGADFRADFTSNTKLKFVKVNGKLNYAKATVEEVSAVLHKETLGDAIKDLQENDLFIVSNDKKEKFYLVQVKKIKSGADKVYYDKKEKKEKTSTADNGRGYMLFNYKPNK